MTSSRSRREVVRAGVGVLCMLGIAGPLLGGVAQAQQKVSKETVQYRDSPNQGHECSGCSNFQPPNVCKVVAGTISPQGWCAIWTPK